MSRGNIQKTFWCLTADIANFDKEVNAWLAEMGRDGYSLFSREQATVDQGDAGVMIFATYCMTLDNNRVSDRFDRRTDLTWLIEQVKDQLFDACERAKSGALTWESFMTELRSCKDIETEGSVR